MDTVEDPNFYDEGDLEINQITKVYNQRKYTFMTKDKKIRGHHM